MLLDLCPPASLFATLLSIYLVFHAAFLVPASSAYERLRSASELLILSGFIALSSGIVFVLHEPGRRRPHPHLLSTLPVRVFLWASFGISLIFSISCYFEYFINPNTVLLGK